MAFTKIKNLLFKTIGLHAEAVGESSIDRAINHRMQAKGCTTAKKYYQMIKAENEELEELIEEVVVPETWFFRNVVPFEVLRDNAIKIHKGAQKKRNNRTTEDSTNPLKVLSIPCSSGEEPYSISMALSESGLRSEDFQIDAVDISKKALKISRRAIYGKHSFREQGISLQEKYFEKIKTGFRLLPSIRKRVTFRQANILTDQISPSARYYDVIFCRNLLIYFDRKTQRLMLDKLSAMLRYGGLLFVGHAEAGLVDKSSFTKINIDKAFSFRKIRSNKQTEASYSGASQSVNKLKDIYDQLVEVTKKDLALSKKINSPKHSSLLKNKKKYHKDGLSKVPDLINSGHFSDASVLCEETLKEQPENPDAYYYLGLISNLQGSRGGAESFLRKAIYLSPGHHKALALSAVLAEERGDNDNAKSLRRREKKARQRNS